MFSQRGEVKWQQSIRKMTKNKQEKQGKTLKDKNALKNVRDRLNVLTQNLLCILHGGRLNRIAGPYLMFGKCFYKNWTILAWLQNTEITVFRCNFTFCGKTVRNFAKRIADSDSPTPLSY